MTRYVALLRGIGPTNPAMRNEKLRQVCEDLGLTNVTTVISSGNVVFDTDTTDKAELETVIEAEWPKRLGFVSTTILRTQEQLQRLVELRPFGDLTHGPETYLLVTFAKNPIEVGLDTPFRPDGSSSSIVAVTQGEVFSVTDTAASATPDVMVWMERRLGKEITSRTWLTVERILRRMGS